jgi:hypothetical protein
MADDDVAFFSGFANTLDTLGHIRLTRRDSRRIRHKTAFLFSTEKPPRVRHLACDKRRDDDDGTAEQNQRRQSKPPQPVERRPLVHENNDVAALYPGEQQDRQRQEHDIFPGR